MGEEPGGEDDEDEEGGSDEEEEEEAAAAARGESVDVCGGVLVAEEDEDRVASVIAPVVSALVSFMWSLMMTRPPEPTVSPACVGRGRSHDIPAIDAPAKPPPPPPLLPLPILGPVLPAAAMEEYGDGWPADTLLPPPGPPTPPTVLVAVRSSTDFFHARRSLASRSSIKACCRH